jgi:NAD(P)-dependent dehydrogenase (short-subunit alcohol dehydrogenase family)
VINNAGVMLGREGILQTSQEAMLETYAINTLGPIFVVQALLKQNLLKSGALLATLTSLVRPHTLPCSRRKRGGDCCLRTHTIVTE